MLGTGERVDVAESGTGVTLTLPNASPTEPDRVAVLVTAR